MLPKKAVDKIHSSVKTVLLDSCEDCGLAAVIEMAFLDYDYGLDDIIIPLMKDQDDDDEYDKLLDHAERVAKNQYDCIMEKLIQADRIIKDAFDI